MIVGLTGGIGSGKSTVAQFFGVLGCAIYNSDERAKEVYYDSGIKEKVISILGKEAYSSNGKIDKDFISKKIFDEKTLLDKINSIIHPAVGQDFKKFLDENSSSKIIIKESALLFETGINKTLDKIILVTSPIELKIKRLKERNLPAGKAGNLSEAEMMHRMKNQWSDEQKIPLSDFVITNDELSGVIPQVLEVYKKLINA